MKVLVSNPCLHPQSIYLPYFWARLKTYIDLDYEKELSVDWLEPLFFHDPVLPNEPFDVLALSCYVWNYEKQYELAKKAKKINPNVFVIAGGPQVPMHDNNIFEQAPIDAICITEGERIFSELLYAIEHNYDIDIPGIILKTNANKKRDIVPKLELQHLSSPWLHCATEMENFAKRIHEDGKRVNVMFETNRGCPYKCAFCDWGMATNSKIKRFSHDMLIDEIDVIMSWSPDFIFVADANYGIFKEDLLYMQKFAQLKQMRETNTNLAFCAAKNNKVVVNQSYKVLHDAKMIPGAMQIGFQHTDEEILKIMDRDNIKTSKSLEEMEESYKHGIPLVGVLILGNPGDTVDKWKSAMCDLLRMQFHEDMRIHDFMLLPNAPAAEPEYMDKYKLGYIEKFYNESTHNRTFYKTKFLCESFSYTRQDYAEMQLYSVFLQACHIFSVFKFISILAHYTTDISYEDFYDYVMNLNSVQKILEPVRKKLNSFVHSEEQNKFMQYNGKLMNAENYIFIQMIDNLDEIFEEFNLDLGIYTEDILKFQKFILLTYDNKKTELTLNFDFKKYFLDIFDLPPNTKIKILPQQITTKYHVDNKVGLYRDINTNKVTDFESLYNRVLKRAPNFRHKSTYYSSVLED